MTRHRLAAVVVLAVLAPGAGASAQYRAQLVASQVISTGYDELNSALSPDGKTLYFTQNLPGDRVGVIMASHMKGGSWSPPELAPFSGRYSDYDPFVTPDGSKLFFISNRPVEGTTPKTTYDIWVVEKAGDVWGPARNLGAPINTDAQEFYPSVAASGTLYFCSTRPGGKGRGDIYRSRLVDGRYAEPETLGDSINTERHECDPFVAPDESYVIFTGYGRPDNAGSGEGDLYISYNGNGVWSAPRHLDGAINSRAREYCPIVSPDGKYFYFTSLRGVPDALPLAVTGAVDLRSAMGNPGNGLGDLYRIDLRAIPLAP